MPREFELHKEIELAATPEQVWEAIATGPGLACWFMPMDIEPREDGTSPAGTVLAWEPGKRLAIRTPEAPDGTTQAFEYLLEARAGGSTVLRFVHSGFLGDDWGDEYESTTGKGWDMYLHTLAQYLTHFPGRTATYVEAEAPPASAAADAWPVLIAGLGLPEPVATGNRVRLTPNGLPPLDGVVDYQTANFLGVRTADGLYRFHGRAALGMPIAVGHHIYTGDVDRERVASSWRSWLNRLFAG